MTARFDVAARLQQSTHYPRFLLFVAGMGGLLYGIDVGIIAGALPYLESTASTAWKLNAQQIGFIVAAVLLGSVLSSLFAGALADWTGRKRAMVLSGALFTASIPIIALADGYAPLLLGRLMQGVSGGLVGVVVPLYLAECLGADQRGRGTAMFQFMLTIGLVVAAIVGLYVAHHVDAAGEAARMAGMPAAQAATALLAIKDAAWRSIFWFCLVPGLIFTAGSLLLGESPRWLARAPHPASARNNDEIVHRTRGSNDTLLSRRYVVPFLLACLTLACTQATGINSILAYVVNILNQAGLPGSTANWADVSIKVLNALMTLLAISLVDSKGRKFLLMLGSGGIVVALLATGLLFQSAERGRQDVRGWAQHQVAHDQLTLRLDSATLHALSIDEASGATQQLTLSYSYGPVSGLRTLRSDEAANGVIHITRTDSIQPDSVIGTFFRRLHLNPFADPAEAAHAPLVVHQAWLGNVPGAAHGWAVAVCICVFVSCFAVGPGVCVWLVLSELMPTRIRSNGMSIALLINQFVSTTLAAIFLPTVGEHGYAAMFYFWAGCTLVYFLTATFLLPETKGKTLEEIEAHFAPTTG